MNKLFTKIASLSVGLAMAVGVGVALGQNKGVQEARAEDLAASFDTTNSVPTGLTATGGPGADQNGRGIGKASITWTLTTTDSFASVTKVVVNAATNGTTNSDSYTLSVSVGGEDFDSAQQLVNKASTDYTFESSGDGAVVVSANNTAGSKTIWIKAISIYTGTTSTKYTVSFNPGEGSGTMTSAKVEDGGKYSLPACTFTAPTGKVFDEWSVGGTRRAVGYELTVTADVEVTALWKEIERVDLPDGDYSVSVSYSGRTSVPTQEYFEIKQPVGDTYYKNLKVEYYEVRQQYSNEYTLNKNVHSYIKVTSESNAVIQSVTFDLYQYINAVVYVCETAVTEAVSGKGNDHRELNATIKAKSFMIKNDATFDQSLWGFTVQLKVSSVPDPVVNFDSYKTSVQAGETGTFTATSQYATNPVYTWASSNADVFTIDSATGEFEALAVGKTTVTLSMTCDEGSDSKQISVYVSPDHVLTVVEAIAIANTLDGNAQETTEYFVQTKGYIVSLDGDGNNRAFNISDNKVADASDTDTILAYGIYSENPLRAYAILNGEVVFNSKIQNFKGTLELKDITVVSYTDAAEQYAKDSYDALDEACETGPAAVTNTLWNQLAADYNALDEYAQAKLTNASSSYVREDVAKFIARYGRIVSAGRENFMNNQTFVSVRLNNLFGNTGIGFVVIVSILGVTGLSFGLFFILRKKKQD